MTPTSTSTSTLPILIAPRLRSPRGGLVVAGRFYRGGCFLPQTARPELERIARIAARVAAVEPTVIGIAGFSYAVQTVAIAPSIGTAAYSLLDLDRNRLHHVHRDWAGQVVCDCGDFTFRRCGSGQPCKHGRRLVELGLIPVAVPTTLPPFARRQSSSPSTSGRTRRFEPGPAEMAEAARLLGWR